MTSYGEDSSDDYEVAADTRDEMRLAGPSSRLDDNDPVYSDIHPDFLNNKQYSPRSPRRNDTIKRRDSLAHTSRNESSIIQPQATSPPAVIAALPTFIQSAVTPPEKLASNSNLPALLLQKQFSESTKNQPKPPDHDDDKLSEYHDDEEFEKHYAPRKKGQSFREAMQVDAKQRQKPQAIKKMQGDSEVQDYIGEGPEQHCMSCDKNLTRILRLEDENHALSRELVALNAKMEYRTKNMEGQAETWKTEALDILRVQEDAKKGLVSKLEQKDRELGCQEWRIAILEAQAEKLKKLIA